MFVLLSDGTGLTSRQSATLLSRAGHRVEVLSPDPLCLCRFTRHVRTVHRVPAYGADPFGWLAAVTAIAERRGADLVLPTQEQVAVLAVAAPHRFRTVVPGFAALARVQDKLSAHATLARIGLPQPAAEVADTPAALAAAGPLPAFVKTPIGTACLGVHRVATRDRLRELSRRLEADGAFQSWGVLVQQPVEGPLVMAQSVFAHGEQVAFHACERVREGPGGGASRKRSLSLPAVREHMAVLGGALSWHGALSADVILGPHGPQFTDINPRLVEPMNAFLSGTDLIGALIDIAFTGTAGKSPDSRPDVRTCQALLAILEAARRRSRRRDVIAELWRTVLRTGDYRGWAEELTPLRHDPLSIVPGLVAAAATVIRPAAWRHFTGGSVNAYSLTPAAWQQILRRREPTGLE
jgi:biotin carboxylase